MIARKFVTCWLLVVLLQGQLRSQEPEEIADSAEPPQEVAESPPHEVSVRDRSGARTQGVLLSKVEIETPHGTLSVNPEHVLSVRLSLRLVDDQVTMLERLAPRLAAEAAAERESAERAFRNLPCEQTLAVLVEASGHLDEQIAEAAATLHAELRSEIAARPYPDTLVTPFMTAVGHVRSPELEIRNQFDQVVRIPMNRVDQLSAAALDCPVAKFPFTSATGTWRVATEEQENWMSAAFDHASWSQPPAVGRGTWIAKGDRQNPVRYVRTKFFLDEMPGSALLQVWGNQLFEGEVWVNGRELDPQLGVSKKGMSRLDITSQLRPGPNVIAMKWRFKAGFEARLEMK